MFVGTALGSLVLIGFLVLGVFTLDERFQGGGEKIEVKIATANADIDTMKERLALTEAKIKSLDQLNDLKARVEAAAGSVEAARVAADKLRREIEADERAHKDYVAAYRRMVRGQAVGMEMDVLKTRSGQSYLNVRVVEINALGMSIMHRDGTCRIPYQDLEPEMQVHYQFAEDEALEAKEMEADIRRQHNHAHEVVKNSTRIQQNQMREKQEREEQLQRERSIQYLESSIESLGMSIKRLDAQIVIEGTKSISRAPAMREELSNLKQQKREMELKLQKLLLAR